MSTQPATAGRTALAPTTPQIICGRLRALVHRGELAPGDRLPPERTLADQLGVARVSLREALAQLQQEGYLVARRGAQGGTFVTELVEPQRRWLERMREDLADLEDIIDYRLAVESHAARLAAERRSTDDMAALDQAVAAMAGASGMRSFRAADTAFHRGLAGAAGSPRLAAAIEEARGLLFLPADALGFPPDVTRAFADHGQIAAAVRDGDAELAALLMRRHIEATGAWLRYTLCDPAPLRPGPAGTGLSAPR